MLRKAIQSSVRILGVIQIQVVVAKAALQSIRLGDAVGENNVWARHESAGQTPPRSGWRVPWDSTKQQELLVSAVAEVTYGKGPES